MCWFFLSKKYLYAFWFNSVTYPIFFVTSRAPGRKILLSHSPTEARLHTMETTAGCGVATNGPLHGGRCLGNPVDWAASCWRPSIFGDLSMFNLADESFQKNSKTHIATYYHIIVIYVFVLFCFHICSLLGFQGVQVFSFVLFLFLTLLMSK